MILGSFNNLMYVEDGTCVICCLSGVGFVIVPDWQSVFPLAESCRNAHRHSVNSFQAERGLGGDKRLAMNGLRQKIRSNFGALD